MHAMLDITAAVAVWIYYVGWDISDTITGITEIVNMRLDRKISKVRL